MRYTLLVIAGATLVAACGRGPTEPTRPPVGPPPGGSTLFGLAGGVFDTAGRPLGQARVEVLDGTQKGTVAVTDDGGSFAFGPVFDAPFTLRASKEGRFDQSKQIVNAQSDGLFKLPLDLRGNYDITFAADAACAGLPAAARNRTYSASFGLSGDSFYLATLSGADFARSASRSYPNWNVMYVSVSEEAVRIFFSDPEIWEHLTRKPDLTPEADLTILGDATATGPFRPDTSQWSFAGRFTYCPTEEPDEYPECQVPEITCVSQHHQLSLTRK